MQMLKTTQSNRSIKNGNGNLFGLFWEGVRQCRLLGVFSMVILMGFTILFPLYLQYDAIRYEYDGVIWNAWDGNFMMLFVPVFAFCMTMSLFHFLNNRAASDVYHALPHKRVTLYISFAGAILFWVVLLIVASSLVSLFFCAVLSKITLLYSTILPYMFTILAISMLVIAGTLIAMSLSGTIFTNLLLAVIILFFPRACVTFIHWMTTYGLPFMAYESSYSLFMDSNNLLFRMIGVFEGSTSEILNPNVGAIVYTIVLAVIYFCIGGVLFYFRRSETAGQSAPSRLFQHLYRILVTMVYCVFVTGILAYEAVVEQSVSDAFVYVILYLIAILIYFTYELITTRKLKNLVTCMPGLGVVVLLNVGLLLGVNVGYHRIVNNCPTADEIVSVSIEGSDQYLGMDTSDYVPYYEYVGLASQDVEITDSTIISILAESYQENLNTWDEGEENYYNKYYEYLYSNASGNLYESFHVVLRTKHGELSRMIHVSEEDAAEIMAILEEDEAYTNLWRNLPESVGNIYLETYDEDLTQADMQEIFACYQSELEEMPFTDLYNFVTGDSGEFSMYYTFYEYGVRGTIYLPISAEMTPRTLQMYYNKLAIYQKDSAEQILADLENGSTNISVDASIYCYDTELGLYSDRMDLFLYGADDGDGELMQILASYLSVDGVVLGESYAVLYVYEETEKTYDRDGEIIWEYTETCVTIPVDDAIFTNESLLQDEDVYYYGENASEYS